MTGALEIEVEIWVCPTPGCGNYYGASSAGDLATKDRPVSALADTVKRAEGTGMRSRCPECIPRGLDVDRVPMRVTLSLSPPAEAVIT